MPSTQTHPPFEAYKGEEPFVFISYAHKDSASVFPELERMAAWGVHIWFDEGIDPGNEWTNEIAFAIKKSCLFILFVTPHSIGSRNCRNEINFALSLDKPFISIHLVETRVADIHPGTALSIESLQAVMKFNMTEASYERKLRKVLADFISSRAENQAPPLPPLPPPASNPLIQTQLPPLPSGAPVQVLPSTKLPPLPPRSSQLAFSGNLPPLPSVLPHPNLPPLPQRSGLPPIPSLPKFPPIPASHPTEASEIENEEPTEPLPIDEDQPENPDI